MKLPQAKWQRREGMRQLLEALGAAGGMTRYVGGCVRDTLHGAEVSDVDLATRLRPEEVLDRLEKAGVKAVPTGIAHGTVTAVPNGRPVEITTLRRDVSTDGRRATIAYTDDWQEDAARRDFTINALSADPASLDVHDYFAGTQDLERGRVRFIGDPLTRIAEDHLRILRFFRFHARFGTREADPEALAACAGRANDLMALSRERIADELLKLLGLPDPLAAIDLMVSQGIFAPIVPDVKADGVERLRRLLEREVISATPPDALRRLAALLPADPELVAAIAARLRLSNKAARRLSVAADRESVSASDPSVLAYRLGAVEAADRILLGDADPTTVRRLDGWEKPRLLVGGGDLIAMGLRPGPLVAKTLQAIEQEWCEIRFPEREEVQRALARSLVDQALRDTQ